jgi:unsaturated chondroitin disaccharide hydrolase
MMDLPLLWWAYGETQDMQYYDVAYNHSLSTIECLIRKDYSTSHVIYFDLKTGEIIKKGTYQGFGDDSCWSRGQAWAIYGFTLAYKTTRDSIFLNTAEKLSTFFLRNLPEDHVPYWDFNFKDP